MVMSSAVPSNVARVPIGSIVDVNERNWKHLLFAFKKFFWCDTAGPLPIIVFLQGGARQALQIKNQTWRAKP